MKTGVGDVTVRFKQVLLPNITMIKVDEINIVTEKMQEKGSHSIGS